MDMVNRSAIVVRPAQPFLDWLHRVDPTSAQLTLEDLRREPTIYLLPEWETEDEALEHLAEVSSEIFKEQLNGWYCVPSVWPEDRELNAFLRWFDCSFHSMVFDVCDERLRHTNTRRRQDSNPIIWTLRPYRSNPEHRPGGTRSPNLGRRR